MEGSKVNTLKSYEDISDKFNKLVLLRGKFLKSVSCKKNISCNSVLKFIFLRENYSIQISGENIFVLNYILSFHLFSGFEKFNNKR